ncbi:hypothetical protein ROA7450_00340 [Roseovarius albus]|uniref:Tetratricopeptide repeat-like domain-containing protein n=1 Tax=Roseovarius albus TaxID=1247867 RepID=A0A1X6YCF0_9RHOB|nr:hypothetical protein [Roseovarius albus]SLN15342.1 hypothetical protein ROA7450_00340 [Roseovarius albus]
MSDTDSFIDEVTEEVRRDRFYGVLRRYGWIAGVVAIALVAGTAWNEWKKSNEQQAAQEFGDSIITALEQPDRAVRADALAGITAPNADGQAILELLTAGEEGSEAPADAAARLLSVADTDGVQTVYRQIATLKAMSLPNSGISVEDKQTRLEGLALSGGVTGLLAEEQLALIDIEQGDSDAALTRLAGIDENAQTTPSLRNRVTQLIVALGGEPQIAVTSE